MSLRIPSFVEALEMSRSRGRESDNPQAWDGLKFAVVGSQGGGSTWYDIGGDDSHGVLTNMDPANDWVTTEKGYALDFDGNDDRVEFSDVELGTAWSACAWVRLDSAASTDGGIFAPGQLWLDVTAGPVWRLGAALGVDVQYSDTSTDWRGKWIHVGWTYTGSVTAFWVNGQADGSDASAGATRDSFDGLGFALEDEKHLNGRIASALAYNRILSSSEFQQLYADPYAFARRRVRVFAAAVVAVGLSIPIAMHHYKQIMGV